MKNLPAGKSTVSCTVSKLLGPYQKGRIRKGIKIAEYLIDAIGEKDAKKLFSFQDGLSKHLMLDGLKHQYKCYQLKKI